MYNRRGTKWLIGQGRCQPSSQGLCTGLLNGEAIGRPQRGRLCMGPAACILSHSQKLFKLLLLLMSNVPTTKNNAESLLRCHLSRRPSSYLGESFHISFPSTLKRDSDSFWQDCFMFQGELTSSALASITTQVFTKYLIYWHVTLHNIALNKGIKFMAEQLWWWSHDYRIH